MRVYHAVFCGGRTHWVVVSGECDRRTKRKPHSRDRHRGPKRCLLHAPTATRDGRLGGGTADGSTDRAIGAPETHAEVRITWT